MRYTEVRLEKVAHSLLDDLDKNTVDFRPNYDDSRQEPTVLPAKFPNLLVNGAGGIAVGMATNIPPHNLGEVIDATIALIDNPRLGLAELMAIMPGPDFPTGGIILGRSGIRAAYETGRGSVIMRGKVAFETTKREREAIIVSEVPFQVNKAGMVEKIAELVRDKRIEGIADIRDESDRDGIRVVIELKRDAVPDVVLNQLYRFTPLQTNFGVNIVALNGGRPGDARAHGHPHELHRLPRGSREPADEVPAEQGARAGARPRRPRDRGRQYRRGHRADPRRARPADGARAVDGAQLAGARHRAAHPAHRRSAPPDLRATAPTSSRKSRRAPSSTSACSG